jgi:hypothetical protein
MFIVYGKKELVEPPSKLSMVRPLLEYSKFEGGLTNFENLFFKKPIFYLYYNFLLYIYHYYFYILYYNGYSDHLLIVYVCYNNIVG